MAHTSRDFHHSKGMKSNNSPLLCTSIKIAVSYSNRPDAHATSKTMHITKANNDYFCKLRALLCCAASKRHLPHNPHCPTSARATTEQDATLAHPAQEDSCGCYFGDWYLVYFNKAN